VYVLELDGGRYYVGKSSDVARRVAEHLSPEGGSGWTRTHKVMRDQHVLFPKSSGSSRSPSRSSNTLEIAHRKGIDNVRGHAWTTVALTKSQRESFREQVCERKDLCRRCGMPGHMVSACSGHGAKAAWMGDGGRNSVGDEGDVDVDIAKAR
ncbi:unnamed protein product, partial [Hapterophycus canaliculatus]